MDLMPPQESSEHIRNDTSESGFAELLRDLSLTPPPGQPAEPPGQPSQLSDSPTLGGCMSDQDRRASDNSRNFLRQRSSGEGVTSENSAQEVRRFSRRISFGDGGLPFDLVNNEYITAMQQIYSSTNLGGSWGLNADDLQMLKDSTNYVDWSMEKNLQNLKDIRKVVRSIFWGFQDIQIKDDADDPPPQVEDTLASRCKRLARQTVESKGFTSVYICLTLYALFGPDLLLMAGHSGMDQDNVTLSVINILVFLAFVLEETLMCWVVHDYLFSLRFFMDSCATLSILGDTAIVAEIINTDAAVAMRSSGVSRAMRGAGRSTRFISILRGLRVWQILKLLPRLQRLTASSTRKLAMLMWQKRMQHVMGYIDKEGAGDLSEEDFDFFTAALKLEFPPPREEAGFLSSLVDGLAESGYANLAFPGRNKVSPFSRSSSRRVSDLDLGRYVIQIRATWETDNGKRAFKRCLDDVTTMKESCTVLYQSLLRLILKICILVLALLLMLQLLNGSIPEQARMQGLLQLQAVALEAPNSSATADLLCQMVETSYAYSFERHSLLLLVIDQRVVWDSTATNPCSNSSGGFHFRKLGSVEEAAVLFEDVIDGTGKERHEILVEQAEDLRWETSAIFDQHQQVRWEAGESLKYSLSVVAMLALLMLYFSADIMHMSSHNCLHPLWDLMDDMNAMKLIELITATNIKKIDQDIGVTQLTRRRCKCKAFAPVPVAQELLGLRKSMSLLESAMIAWSKYVPVILLKQVMNAGVEANIGCIPTQVSIFFCDIKGFKEICTGKTPKEVLSLLDVVLEGVNQALEQNGGTLLEFIGDEVLAVFNAPKKIEMYNLAAVNAALEAIQISENLIDEPVHLQCSVHTGEVLAGNIGSPTRMKYGLLGDGVNLAARLKSLNTRYGTQLLVSSETLQSSIGELFVARTIGKLVLKGRTTPTHTLEVIGRKGHIPQDLEQAAESHENGFTLFSEGRFEEAKVLFEQANSVFCEYDEGAVPQDKPSALLCDMCNMYVKNPPPMDKWDGSEHLNKKAW